MRRDRMSDFKDKVRRMSIEKIERELKVNQQALSRNSWSDRATNSRMPPHRRSQISPVRNTTRCPKSKQSDADRHVVYGEVGLGKTHLATAVSHQLWTNGKRKVLFMPAEVFMNEAY